MWQRWGWGTFDRARSVCVRVLVEFSRSFSPLLSSSFLEASRGQLNRVVHPLLDFGFIAAPSSFLRTSLPRHLAQQLCIALLQYSITSTPPRAPPSPTTTMAEYDVAVIGTGVSSCYCTYLLSKCEPALRVCVFESSVDIGGRHSAPGARPRWVRDSFWTSSFVPARQATTAAIVDALGVETLPCPVDKRGSTLFFPGEGKPCPRSSVTIGSVLFACALSCARGGA